MAGRIEIEPQRAAVALPEAVLHEIRSDALAAAPEECCGLVFGRPSDDASIRFQRVYRCQNVMDRMHQEDPAAFPRTSHDGFYIDPVELKSAVEAADAAGLEVTLVYHSHVGARAYFSELDQSDAVHAFPRADQLVVSVLDGRTRGEGLFRRAGDVLVGHPVVPWP